MFPLWERPTRKQMCRNTWLRSWNTPKECPLSCSFGCLPSVSLSALRGTPFSPTVLSAPWGDHRTSSRRLPFSKCRSCFSQWKILPTKNWECPEERQQIKLQKKKNTTEHADKQQTHQRPMKGSHLIQVNTAGTFRPTFEHFFQRGNASYLWQTSPKQSL